VVLEEEEEVEEDTLQEVTEDTNLPTVEGEEEEECPLMALPWEEAHPTEEVLLVVTLGEVLLTTPLWEVVMEAHPVELDTVVIFKPTN